MMEPTLEIDPIAESPGLPLLCHISIGDLFGRFSYELELPSKGSSANRLALFFGDNGSGKTTILRLIWHLLSPADNRGHRSFLSKTPFARLRVSFCDDSFIEVIKENGLLGDYTLRFAEANGEPIDATFIADEDLTIRPTYGRMYYGAGFEPSLYEGVEPGSQEFALRHYATDVLASAEIEKENNREAYIDFLNRQQIGAVYLADDRQLYADDPELEEARDRFVRRSVASARHGRTDLTTEDPVVRELGITIRRVNEWLSSMAFAGQAEGSASANTIYRDVLRQMTSTFAVDDDADPVDIYRTERSHQLLKELAETSPRLEEFNLVPTFPAGDYIALLRDIPDAGRRRLAEDIIVPYLDSLKKRYEALEEAERIIRSMLTLLNGFFIDKAFTYDPRRGLRIETLDGTILAHGALSSGERQLTMLVCTTLLASRDSRLLIVDEPELSLGVEWQRRIVPALIDITEGSALQLLVATHSVEMLTSQRESIVQLPR